MFALWITSASAYDPASLRSDVTFELFRDAYDDLREPATLADHEGTDIYTLLGNQGASHRFALGTLADLGGPVLGAIADGGGAGSTSTNSVPGLGEARATRTTFDRTRDGAAFIGLGVPVGRASLGFGAEIDRHARTTTLVAPANLDESGSVPIPGGSLVTEIDEDGSIIAESHGEWREREVHARAIVGLAVGDAPDHLEIDAQLTRTSVVAEGEAWSESADGAWTYAGGYPGTLAEVADGWAGGLTIDGTRAFSDVVAIRVLVNGEAGPHRPFVVRTTEAFESRDPSVSSFDATWDTTPISGTAVTGRALIVAQITGDKVDVRVGASVFGDLETDRALLTTTLDGVARSAEVTHSNFVTLVQLPIAAEITASPGFTLRFGGRFTAAGYSFDEDLTPADDSPTTTLASTQTRTYVELAAGFRYDVVPAFSLDLAVLGADQPGQRATIDLRQVFISAVFHV